MRPGCFSLIAIIATICAQTVTKAYAAPSTWALLVGVGKYRSPMIAGLAYPADDASAIADALTDPRLGSLPRDHVLLLTDDKATAAAIEGSVDSFFKPRVKEGDTIVVFLAGHGVTKGVGTDAKAYLLPADVAGLTTQALDGSAVDLRAFANRLSDLPAANFVAFVDACREDPTPGRAVKPNMLTDIVSDSMQILPHDRLTPVSSVTFFACSIGQRAYEDPTYKHGVFTYWILDGIRRADVPREPDGAIEMGTLASYVGMEVARWARDASASGDFEIDQTPEVVTSMLPSPVILTCVHRGFSGPTIIPSPPTLIVDASPEAATISVDGVDVGTGSVEKLLGSGGQHTIVAKAPGYLPLTEEVTTFPGYAEQFTVDLAPTVDVMAIGGAAPPTVNPTIFTKACDAEARQEYDVAEAGYSATIEQHPGFSPAYEALAELERKEGRNGEYVGTLVDMIAKTDPSAHALALLSQAYSLYAFQGPGASAPPTPSTDAVDTQAYRMPKSQSDAAALALKAARRAVVDDTLAEAQRSLGLALVASDFSADAGGQPIANRAEALKALGLAVILALDDGANHYALGFAIRFYARRNGDVDGRKSDLERAIVEQQLAVTSTSYRYEAYRELAYCHHLLGDLAEAQKDYEMANAYRGEATDGNEVAGVNCALAVLARVQADAPLSNKGADMAESKGYWDDARDINPDLTKPLTTLKAAGLRDQVEPYLPDGIKHTIDWGDKPGN